MATQYDTQIQQLYVAYFNRPADAAGLAHWAGAMAQGITAAQISAAFATSLEYQVEYSQATNAGVVTQVYQNLFGRAPEASGLAFWVKALTDKTITVDNLVTTIAAGAQTTDKVAYDSKVVVATAFTAALDTDAEKAGYSGADANKAAKALLSGIKTAADATAAVSKATLDASVAAVIKAGTPFTLEAGLAALGATQKAVADFLADAEVLDEDGDVIETPIATDVTNYVGYAEADVAALITVGTYVPKAIAAVPGKPAVIDDPATPVDESAPAVPAKPAVAATLPGVKAALIAEQTSANAKALTTAQTALTDAQKAVAGITGLNSAIAAATSAEEASVDAAQAAQLAVVAANSAEANLPLLNPTFTVGGTATTITLTPKAGGTTVTVATFKDGAWSISTGVTAATYPGLAEVVATANAEIATAAEAVEAKENALFAQVEVEFRDRSTTGTDALKLIPFDSENGPTPAAGAVPTLAQIRDELNALRSEGKSTTVFENSLKSFLTANDAARADDVIEANAAVKAAQTKITAFEAALAEFNEAKAVAAELKGLTDAYNAAMADFAANDYVEPSLITGAKFGTTGSDIFVFDDVSATITSFGRSGDDVLYVGAGFTLNEGKLTAGNDAALEVFFAQKGANAEITIETKAYGSDSGDVKVITLTGVSIEDLTFENGIITL